MDEFYKYIVVGLQGDQTSQSQRKSTLNTHWKDWCWISNTLATWCEELTHWKDSDAGKDQRQKKRATEVEMVGCHHLCNGHELGQTLGDGEGQRSLVCCSPGDREEMDTTWWLNNFENITEVYSCKLFAVARDTISQSRVWLNTPSDLGFLT